MENKINNIIIGCVDRYNWSQISNWVKSINKHIPCCTKIMLVYDVAPECISNIKDNGFIIYQGKLNNQIVVQRFFDMWKIISTLSDDMTSGWLLATDVKDVIFQSDPFKWLNVNASSYDLVSSSENISYNNEQWSKNNVLQCFGKNIAEMMLSDTIYNAGVIAGKTQFLKDLFLINYLLSLGSKSHNPDQTTYNILLHTLLKYCKVFKPSEKEAWAAQIGTTMDPSKDYAKFNIEPNPIFDNEKVVNTANIVYSIVHQYDRNPILNTFYNKIYEQN